MNKLFFAAGIALSALGVVATTPAQASTLNFGFATDASLTVDFNPLLVGASGITLPNSLNVEARDVVGNFTVLNDPSQLADGEISFNNAFASAILEDVYESTVQSFLADFGVNIDWPLATQLFDITQFTGIGLLTSSGNGLASSTSIFNVTSDLNSVVIDVYNTGGEGNCLSGACKLIGDISFGVGLDIGEFVTFADNVLNNPGVSLPQTTQNALGALATTVEPLQPAVTSFDLGTVTAAFSATTEFLGSDPDGTTVDFTITGGSVAITTPDGAGAPGPNAPQSVPEPSMVLGLLGGVGLFWRRCKQTVVG
ncbi:PEP-CTERM sorting domain-containing protein [Leptothoe kymatousa]|uniref:PEP-CTERM sorting domain-containing protein n=1 Tax=Leptothoe kymatousa TAU-MAC 1615 TaxID=2364775 RepID=A0ABS5Y4M9_9CYAN|nr:PEP-CTERM sorting domain-containing protein [Leptothoe kymatousa]MBT9312788.1 PEP-CTERM sorting domain-containing protein [Leptothoe kymatousa TAU-MAC 1615]